MLVVQLVALQGFCQFYCCATELSDYGEEPYVHELSGARTGYPWTM